MGWLPDSPALVLVALTLASILLLVEVALPTFGLAGLSGLALAGLALAAVGAGDRSWWPLVAVAAAVSLWAVLLTARRAPAGAQTAAAALFGAGSIGYGLLARDVTTVVLGAAGSAALPLAFRPLLRATTKLLDLPAQTGMDALVGRSGSVVRWQGRSGTVRVEGSLWNARGEVELEPGAEVVVLDHDRMTVRVALRESVP